MAFLYKYIFSVNKTPMLVRMTAYISACLTVQYILFVINLTPEISPATYPIQFNEYPFGERSDYGKDIKYGIPVFFQIKMFHDLKLGYFTGIGI